MNERERFAVRGEPLSEAVRRANDRAEAAERQLEEARVRTAQLEGVIRSALVYRETHMENALDMVLNKGRLLLNPPPSAGEPSDG